MFNTIRLFKGLLLFKLIFLLNFCALSQTTKVDELVIQLKESNTDSAKISIMRKLSVAYSAVDPTMKYFYANQYRMLAEKNGIDSVVANAYLDMGHAHALKSNLDSALYYFKIGHEKAKSSNFISGIARGYINIGFTYDRLDRKKESIDYYTRALKIYRQLKHKKGINQCITNLGSMYFDLSEYKIADQYFKQVLENLKETPNDLMGMGAALYSLGGSNRKLGNSKKAMDYYTKSLSIREKLGDINGIGLSNWGIGQLLVEQKKYANALPYINIALKNNRLLKNLYQENAVLITAARAYIGLNDFKKAEEHANLALIRGKESNSKIPISLAYDVLSDIYAAKKDFAAALQYKRQYNEVIDSLEDDHTTKEVILKDLYRINKDNSVLVKSNKNINEKNSDYVIVISVITALLIIVAVLLILYYERNEEKKNTNLLLQKQKKEIAEVNEELSTLNEELITQMNIVSSQNEELEKLNSVKNKFFSIVSHDLRSPLNNLKILFELYHKGDLTDEELNDLLIRLEETIYTTAGFLDNLLEWSKNQLDGINIHPVSFSLTGLINENLSLAESQIKAKSLIIENNIDVSVKAYADPNMINVVIRNLLANAIKFCNISDKISFNANVSDREVIITIADTGTGIAENRIANLFSLTHQTSTGTSGEKGYQLGLILCNDMVKQNKGQIALDSELGKGTTFYITLPKRKL